MLLFETATLRSGYQLGDTKEFAGRIERMLRLSMNVDQDEQASLQPFLLLLTSVALKGVGRGNTTLACAD